MRCDAAGYHSSGAEASGLPETLRCVVGGVADDFSKAYSASSLRVNQFQKARRHIAADVCLVWDTQMATKNIHKFVL